MKLFSTLFRIFYLFCCFKLIVLLTFEFIWIIIENFSWCERISAHIKKLKKQWSNQLNEKLNILWEHHLLLHAVYLVIKSVYLLLTLVVYVTILINLITRLFH